MAKWTTALALALLPCSAAAETLQVGQWRAEYDDRGVQHLFHGGIEVLRGAYIVLYKPEYQGAWLQMQRSDLSLDEQDGTQTITWRKTVEEAAEAEMRLRLMPEQAELSVVLGTQAPGPYEIGFYVPRETLYPEDKAWLRVGQLRRGMPRDLLVGPEKLEAMGGITGLIAETSDAFVELELSAEPGGLLLQDHRASDQRGLRLVQSGEAGEEPLEISATATVRVRENTAEERDHPMRPRRIEVLAGENGGFEQGLEGWQQGGNATADEDTPHEGQRSLHMTVAGLEGPIYVTRQVPVAVGSWYRASAWVRSEAVKAAEVQGRSSTGAALILEWADPQGEWLTAGAYSPGLYADNDWTRLQVRELKAPPGAGYAVIFLALRALGDAWFDDVQLQQWVPPGVRQLSPRDGEEITDNRPELTWEKAPVAAYVVQICTDAGFPPKATTEAECWEPRYRPDVALGTATHYWRIRREDSTEFGPPWSFVQAAAATDDTTGPALSIGKQSLSDPQEFAAIRWDDPSGVKAGTAQCLLDGEPPPDVQADEAGIRCRPTGGWSTGLHYVEVTVQDDKGNESHGRWPVVVAQAVPPISFRADGVTLYDGKPIFPVGIYNVPPEEMAQARAAGFDVVHAYRWESSQDDRAARAYLDAAQAAGLKVFIGFDRGISSGSGLMQGNLEMICRRVGALIDHPALMYWYLYDEPEHCHQLVPPDLLRREYQTIKALDPYHPVSVVCSYDDPGSYLGSFDVFWSEDYTTPASVARRMISRRDGIRAATPVTAIVHCFDRALGTALRASRELDLSEFQPDYRRMRCNAFTTIALRSCGLLWWWYGDGMRRTVTAADVPAAWEDLRRIIAEIKELEPVLVAEAPLLEVTWEPAEAPLVAWAKRVDGKTTIIATTTGEEATEVTLRCRSLPQAGQATVKFEGRPTPITDGAITDRFQPDDVHIYQVEGTI